MKIALIGYGEVERILGEDLRAAGQTVTAFDLKLDSAEGEAMRAHARAHGVTLAGSHAEAVRSAELVISAVTASQTIAAAEASAAALPSAASSSISTRPHRAPRSRPPGGWRGGAGRYVEGAVMTAVPPYRIKVAPAARRPRRGGAGPAACRPGLPAKLASGRLGVASATKMCRSVIIKGLEAMTVESMTAARHYGVEDAVLASLGETFPGIDWEKQAVYFFQRVIEHGRRRGEELSEAAVTVQEAGLSPWSAAGTAERQTWVADLADGGVFGERGSPGFARTADWRVEADRILDQLHRPRER